MHQEAFALIYGRRVRAFVGRLVVPGMEVDDVLQEIAVRVHRALAEGRGPSRLDAWVFTIARHVVVDLHRSARPAEPLEADLASSSPERPSFNEEASACASGFASRLPANYRSALLAADLGGAPMAAVAAAEGTSVSGAKSRVQRARAMVRERLLACCEVETDGQGHVVTFEPRGRASACPIAAG